MQEDLYTLRLTDENGKRNQFLPSMPSYRCPILRPTSRCRTQGGYACQRREEVLVAADVDDDYGVATFELVFFVGGGDAQSISLLDAPGNRHSSGEHLLFWKTTAFSPVT